MAEPALHRLRELFRRLPFTLRWHKGTVAPPVGNQEILVFEDVGEDLAKIFVRLSGRTFVFTSVEVVDVIPDAVDLPVIRSAAEPPIPTSPAVWIRDRQSISKGDMFYFAMQKGTGVWTWAGPVFAARDV